jgi:hypothetical protein
MKSQLGRKKGKGNDRDFFFHLVFGSLKTIGFFFFIILLSDSFVAL